MTVSVGNSALVEKFDHVAIAVPDIAVLLPLYVDVLGGQLIAGGDDEDIGVRNLQLWYPPNVKIELIQPLGDTSYLAAYLAKHGQGIHHMTCFVNDVGEAERCLGAHGVGTVDTRRGTGFWDETYIRPSSGFGTLIQLGASDLEWSQPVMPDGAQIADVLAGRIVWHDARPYWRQEDRGGEPRAGSDLPRPPR